jgi:predicted solute-binding protein
MQYNKKRMENIISYGVKKKLSEKTGLSYRTVLNYFNGIKISIKNEEKIIQALKEYNNKITEFKRAKEELMKF